MQVMKLSPDTCGTLRFYWKRKMPKRDTEIKLEQEVRKDVTQKKVRRESCGNTETDGEASLSKVSYKVETS
jgi:hypothetical protein